MKMNDEIKAALKVLQDAAENDFERHRIEILINDLTAPPQIEVIDDKHQRFNGITFARHGKEKYYSSTALRVHVAIYDYYFGVPKGYEVHHKDVTPDNNDISNLQLLTPAAHKKAHWNIKKNAVPNEFVCVVCGEKFSTFATAAKFCSAECESKYRYQNSKDFQKVCPVCGKTFTTKDERQKTCSLKCGGKIHSEGTFEERHCVICGKVFKTRKRYKTATCCHSCATKLFHKNHPNKNIKFKPCPVCGKIFKVTGKHPNQNCCSRSCAAKLRSQNSQSPK